MHFLAYRNGSNFFVQTPGTCVANLTVQIPHFHRTLGRIDRVRASAREKTTKNVWCCYNLVALDLWLLLFCRRESEGAENDRCNVWCIGESRWLSARCRICKFIAP